MEERETQELPAAKTEQLPRTVAVRGTRRILIAVAGGLLVTVGLVSIPVPVVPGWLLVIAGLTVLSWEFHWARRLLHSARARLSRLRKGKTKAPPGGGANQKRQ